MTSVRYGSERRYLVKVLREVARRIERIASSLDEPALGWRLDEDDPTAAELLSYLRDAEREDLRAISGLLAADGAAVQARRASPGASSGPTVGDDSSVEAEVAALLWDFAVLRDELVWQLETAGEAWAHAGRHPYRGSLPLTDLVREVGDRDLDVMWRLQRIAAQAPGARRRAPQRRRARRLEDEG
jgi:hypothetical protein